MADGLEFPGLEVAGITVGAGVGWEELEALADGVELAWPRKGSPVCVEVGIKGGTPGDRWGGGPGGWCAWRRGGGPGGGPGGRNSLGCCWAMAGGASVVGLLDVEVRVEEIVEVRPSGQLSGGAGCR